MLGCLAGIAVVAGLKAATVTINPGVTYQTIDGFGTCGAKKSFWESAPFHDAAFVNQAVNDLGFSIARTDVHWDMEPANDNADPNNLDLSKFVAGARMNGQLSWFKALQDAGVKTFIASVWSPPSWMKDNNNFANGSLRTDMYAEFAEYCIAFCRRAKQNYGVDIDALSLQNEPWFNEDYGSCKYTPEQYRDLLKIAGPMFERAGLATKFFVAEDMLSAFSNRPYHGVVNADPVARNYMDIFAVHGYTDGVNPNPGSTAATLWSTVYNRAKTVGAPVWMTETSGYTAGWTGGFQLAQAIYAALKYGKASAWLYWLINYYGDEQYTLMVNGTPNARYYASKQFYKFVRPGAVQIESASDDLDVAVVAFAHPQDRTLVYVLLNQGVSAKSVTLSGTGLPSSFAEYRSSASENCVSRGTLSGGSLSVPSKSVVTLVGNGYTLLSTGVAGSHGRPDASAARMAGKAYGLDGRVIHAGRGRAGALTLSQVVVRPDSRPFLSVTNHNGASRRR